MENVFVYWPKMRHLTSHQLCTGHSSTTVLPARRVHLAKRRCRRAVPRSVYEDSPGPQVAVDVEQLVEQLTLVKRQLDAAVAEEDYGKAQQLKQQADALKQQLPPVLQYVQHQLDQLKAGSLSDKRAAVQALGGVGSETCIPGLASCLGDPELNALAQDALWAIFHRHPEAEVLALMDRGKAMMEGGTAVRYRSALDLFEQAARLAPSFAEAHNKKATVLYLLREYKESIDVCKLVLELNPYHFGAASGMGMCYIGLEDYAAALSAFESALSINPGMEPIQKYAAALRAKLGKADPGELGS